MANSLIDFLQFNIATSKEIQNNTGLSQASVAREIQKLGNSIIKIANGRSPKYALTINAFGVGDAIHIWEVDNFGKHSYIATLRPLSAGGFFVEENIGMPSVFLGEAKKGFYDSGREGGLPYFLDNMAPQGFLGRKIAETLSKQDDFFPNDLRVWKYEHIGRYLLANTEHSIGNLKFGNNANLNLRQSFIKRNRNDYLDIADNIMNNEEGLSSAGGEHQKFTTFCNDINAHVMVKFSPKGDNENAQRWKDVLITEHYANKIINDSGFLTAAKTHIFEAGGRLFLESERFDRMGEQGRRSMLSLSVIDAEFCGVGDDWLKSAIKLYEQELITEQDLTHVEVLAIFAKLINNSDTHLGNISFETHNNGFSLLPIYDMCSMGFAPKSNGEVLPFKFSEPTITTINNVSLEAIKQMVKDFWQLVAKDERISQEFKTFLDEYLNQGQENLF